MLYLVALAQLMVLQAGFQTGNGMVEFSYLWSDYDQGRLMETQFMRDEIDDLKSADDIYNFIEKLQNERLWVPVGVYSPYQPIGALRLEQKLVKRDGCTDRVSHYHALYQVMKELGTDDD